LLSRGLCLALLPFVPRRFSSSRGHGNTVALLADLRTIDSFALIESSAGKIGSLADQLLLYCYHYDPAMGSYSFVAMNAVRVGGAVTVVALLGFVVLGLRRERRAAD
jgi:hypothetical protein